MKEDKILLVGQAPSRNRRPALDASIPGSASCRLLAMLGITRDEYMERFARVNLLDYWPGALATGKGDKFPIGEAKKAAKRILAQYEYPWKILCVGHRVGECFLPKMRVKYYDWMICVSNFPPAVRDIAIIPHTSGLNRYWNEPGNIKLAENFLRKKVLFNV